MYPPVAIDTVALTTVLANPRAYRGLVRAGLELAVQLRSREQRWVDGE